MKHHLQESTSSTTRATTGRQRAGDEWKSGGADKEEIRRKVESAGRPGPGHRALDALVGDWKAEFKCWSEPGGEANTSQGMAKTRWTLDGHFLEEEFHGEMMGQQFTGRNLIGYDNMKQTFNSVWVSDMQTSMFTCEGRGENNNRVITLEGTASCSATGRTDIPMKTVFRILSPDKHIFEMFDGSRGGDGKTMEITYTRS